MDDNAATLADGLGTAFEALVGIDQSVLDAIPSAVYVCAADGVIVRYNRCATELWGRTPKLGDTDQRFCGGFRLYRLDGTLLPSAATPMATALDTGEPQHDHEVEIERPDGSRIIVQVNIEPLKDPAGQVQGAINCFHDITERKRADEMIRARHSELEDFFENANVPMHWVASDGRVVRANRAELELLGYAADEYVGHHIAEFHADQETIDDILSRLGRGEQLELYPATLRAKDGSARRVLISSSVQFLDDRFVHTRCITLDVSAQQDTHRLAAIVDSSDDAIISKDLNGVVTSWNRGAERLFGYTAGEAVGQPLVELVIPAERHSEEDEILARMRQGMRIEPYETVRQRKDGSRIDVQLTVSPVSDANGRVVGAAKIARDISERKRHEKALARHAREQSALYRFVDQLQRARSPEDIYEAALDAICRAFDCRRASVLRFDAGGVMRFVGWRGLSDHYRETTDGHSPWQAGARRAEPITIDDIDDADEPEALKAVIRREGIGALAFIPLFADGEVIGKFMVYHDAPHAFSESEIDLAVTIARQLGFSLERYEADAARRRVEEALRQNQERLRLATYTGKVGLWTWEIATGEVSWTESLYAVHGVDRAEFVPTRDSFLSLVHPDDRDAVIRAIARSVEDDAPYEIEFRAVRPDGDVVWLFTNAVLVKENDEPARMVGATCDVTELKQAEERFRLAIEAAPSGMLQVDQEGSIHLVNAHAEALLGYDRGELIGRKVEMLVPERFRGTHPAFRDSYDEAPEARPMGAGRELYALRKDGSEVPVEIGLSPVRTSEGLFVLSAIVDISERKRAETQREMLLAELNHRVKNTLAVVQGIAYQTFKDTDTSPTVLKAFEGRLGALARAHALLTQSSWENASLDDLVAEALSVAGADERRVEAGGPCVLLDPRPALAVAIALHELSTNALKYGALSVKGGQIAVKWQAAGPTGEGLKLIWQESGGPRVSTPGHRGFGTRMIEGALAHDLGGTVVLEFQPEGLRCVIETPLREGETK